MQIGKAQTAFTRVQAVPHYLPLAVMDHAGYWIGFAVIYFYLTAGASAVKCTHCAYVNDGLCHSVACEGNFCAVQVTIDTRVAATLVHKSCEELDPVGPTGVTDNHGHRCLNSTRGEVVFIVCSCQTEFCTSTLGNEELGISGSFGARAALAAEGAAPVPAEANATTPIVGEGLQEVTTTPALEELGLAGGLGNVTESPQVVGGPAEVTTTSIGSVAPLPGEGIPAGNYSQETTVATAENITASAEGTPIAPLEGASSAGAEITSTPFDLFGAASPSATPTPETPAGPETGNETSNETSQATVVDLFFGVPTITTSGAEGNETIGTTAAESPTEGATAAAIETTTAAIVVEPVGGEIMPPATANASTGIEDMEETVVERVNFFSAASLQRLPSYLASDVVLISEKHHYDVSTGRFDGDMVFNQLQLDDIVESERIYLPPKPIQEFESSGPDPFNGVLIGRDLEQVNAWPSMEPIVYVFASNIDAMTKAVVRTAFDQWENNTCVKFQEGTSPGPFIILVETQASPTDAVTCGAATVGRWPNVTLVLWQAGEAGTGCLSVGTIAHQVGHILGLWHAQSRFDAYNYVYVMADVNGIVDVHPQSASQSNFDIGYDYGSIMHFNLEVLRPKDPRYSQTVGQRREPSFIDYKTVNLQQRCTDLCPQISCFVGGYATPPDCTSCHCPSGFGGQHCETVQESVGECGPTAGSRFASDEWKQISVTFTMDKGAGNENKCFWHMWGSNGNQVEVEVVNVSLHSSPLGCTNDLTGERNFIEIKIGDNDADKGFDFQRTGFRICNLDTYKSVEQRPIVSSNRLIVLAVYAGTEGSFTVRFRNVGGGDAGVASSILSSAVASPVRPGVQAVANETAAAEITLEAGEEDEDLGGNPQQSCFVRRSLVPGDRLSTPCRKLQSYYGRYTYYFTKNGHHKIYFNEKYFEPSVLIFEARQTERLNDAVMVNDNGFLRIEDGGAQYEAFPYFLSAQRQKELGHVKLVMTEDGRLAVRSLNGTEVTVVCLAHFSCVRLHRRLQSSHHGANDTRIMLQGGIIYSDNRLFFLTLNAAGEMSVWKRAKATDPLSTGSSKSIWTSSSPSKGRAGQPYRVIVESKGYPTVRDGDNDIVWQLNATAPLGPQELPTSFSLSDQGKLILTDGTGKTLWSS